LPPEETLIELIRFAMKEMDNSRRQVSVPSTEKAMLPLDLPEDVKAALHQQPEAMEAFEALPPSHKKEHLSAIAEAKRPETRRRRIAKMIEMLAAGKAKS
jgi:uncharacterized protein YdeI (YjbR/CyaY-like superfamily)